MTEVQFIFPFHAELDTAVKLPFEPLVDDTVDIQHPTDGGRRIVGKVLRRSWVTQGFEYILSLDMARL